MINACGESAAGRSLIRGGCSLSEAEFFRRSLIAIGLLILGTSLFVIAYQAVPVLMLIFLAVLLAIFTRTVANFVQRRSGWRYRWCMLIVVGGTVGLIALGGFLLGPNAAAQINGVMHRLPEVREKLELYGWSGLLYHIPGVEDLLAGRLNIWGRITTSFSFSATFGPLISIGLVVVIGLYLAASPELYLHGAVLLCPVSRQGKCRRVLNAVGETLRWWLLGQAIGMLFIGLTVSIGLAMLHLPLPLPLGVFAGLMAFIPNIGYFLSIAPAILFAVLHAPLSVFYVVVLYTGAHWGNDYVLLPLVQRRVIHLPPALLIGMQLLLGFLLGGIGLIIATPFVAALLVLVKTLYLGHEPESVRRRRQTD